jgi:sialic acid synthase SpsE
MMIEPPSIVLASGRRIGPGRTFVIAEVGSNHMRSLDTAREHIQAAAAAGADAVKFQSIDLKELYHQPSAASRALHDKIDLPEDWHAPLKQHCDQFGVAFLSSPTYLRAVDVLESVNTEIYKLASAQIGVFPQLVQRVAALGKPVVLSTGLVVEKDLERVVKIFRQAGNHQFIILHCNSVYPAPAHIVHLPRMLDFQRRFGCLVGFSDHTRTHTASIAAVAMGAALIERHFTLSRALDSPDAPLSLEPTEFAEFVNAVREAGAICQIEARTSLEPAEAGFKSAIRHTLVALQDIPAGVELTSSVVALKRGNPAPGIDAWTVFESPRPRHAARAIAAGSWLTLDDIRND